MNDQPQFLSRRELRDAERAGLVEAQELSFDGAPRVESVSVPVEQTGQPLTRRQLRELEKTGGILAVHTSQIQLPVLPQDMAAPTEVSQPARTQPDQVLAEREEPMTMANPVVALPPTVDEEFERAVYGEPAGQPVRQIAASGAAPAPTPTANPEPAPVKAPAAMPAAQARSFEVWDGPSFVSVSEREKRRGRIVLLVVGSLLMLGGATFFALGALGYFG